MWCFGAGKTVIYNVSSTSVQTYPYVSYCCFFFFLFFFLFFFFFLFCVPLSSRYPRAVSIETTLRHLTPHVCNISLLAATRLYPYTYNMFPYVLLYPSMPYTEKHNDKTSVRVLLHLLPTSMLLGKKPHDQKQFPMPLICNFFSSWIHSMSGSLETFPTIDDSHNDPIGNPGP